MIGLGTIINSAAIVTGGIFGLLFGKLLNERLQDTLQKANGICVIFIGVAGAMEGMLKLSGSSLSSGRSMFTVLCIVFGAFLGEIINLERLFERFGEWLKIKTGNAKDKNFINGFVTASLTVCIGAMAVVGSIKDGLSGDYSILATKAVLDFIIITVMTCTLGKGCIFSAIPVAVFQGTITALARLIKPLMTAAALANISLIGSILIFCVGLNLLRKNSVKVANMLPTIIIAIIWAFVEACFI